MAQRPLDPPEGRNGAGESGDGPRPPGEAEPTVPSTTEELVQSERRLHLLADNIRDVIFRLELHPELCLDYVSPAIERVGGYPQQRFYDNPRFFLELLHPDDRGTLEELLAAPKGEPGVLRWVRRDGAVIFLEWTSAPIRDDTGRVVAIEGVARDVTERQRVEEELRFRTTQLAEAQEVAGIGSWEIDLETREIWWSDELYRLYGVDKASFEPSPGRVSEFVHSADQPAVRDALESQLRDPHPQTLDYRIVRPDGAVRWMHADSKVAPPEHGRPQRLIGTSRDVTDQREADDAVRRSQEFLAAITANMAEGLCAVDTEGRITFVNPAAERLLGWTESDLMSTHIYETIHDRRPDGSAQPEGDCPTMDSIRSAKPVWREDDVFSRKDGTRLPVAYSASPIVSDGEVGGAIVVFHDISERKGREEELERELDSLAWVGRIRDALTEDRMVLHAQPIIDLASGEVVQEELLIRMLDGNGGLVAPGRFLPTAERFGLIKDIDHWVVARAVKLACEGRNVEVNLSGASIGDLDMLAVVERELQESGADPSKLVFEITETALMQNAETGEKFARRLSEIGCGFALDDFGTGYGGFTYLKRLPVQFLKIDIEFVLGMKESSQDRHLVTAVVNLAQGFQSKTIAEGVEDQETLELLRECGVDYAQGYHLGHPAPLVSTGGPGG